MSEPPTRARVLFVDDDRLAAGARPGLPRRPGRSRVLRGRRGGARGPRAPARRARGERPPDARPDGRRADAPGAPRAPGHRLRPGLGARLGRERRRGAAHGRQRLPAEADPVGGARARARAHRSCAAAWWRRTRACATRSRRSSRAGCSPPASRWATSTRSRSTSCSRTTGETRGVALFQRSSAPLSDGLAAARLPGRRGEPAAPRARAREARRRAGRGAHRAARVRARCTRRSARPGVDAGQVLAVPVSGEEVEAGLLVVPLRRRADERSTSAPGSSRPTPPSRCATPSGTRRRKERAFIDDVTEVYNARYLLEAMDREIRRAERYGAELSVLFLDLDRFKLVNDRHGHLVGSQALRQLSRVLAECVRQVDTLARYGGDEFTIVLARHRRDRRRAGRRAHPPRGRGDPLRSGPRRDDAADLLGGPRDLSRATGATAGRCSTPPTRRCTGPSRWAGTGSAPPASSTPEELLRRGGVLRGIFGSANPKGPSRGRSCPSRPTRSRPRGPLSRLDPLGRLRRTHRAGDVDEALVGREVVLAGWVQRRRDHGGVVFVDLRDRTGLVQVVFRPDAAAEAHARAAELRSEFVLVVRGPVSRRSAETVNRELPTRRASRSWPRSCAS